MKNYENSKFYKKYKDTYYSNYILNNIFGENVDIPEKQKEQSYEKIHIKSREVIADLLELYISGALPIDERKAYEIAYDFYEDPDSGAVKEICGISCTADGLISLNRLYKHEGFTERLVKGFETYRKMPIFFFPAEKNGINGSRCYAFGDRIDHTLYDIKKYMEAKTDGERQRCRLTEAYVLPKTKKWLEEMGSFKNLVEWYGVRGTFINDDYEVFDIEKNDGSIILGYLPQYKWNWSEDYYQFLKEKIEVWMSRMV